MKRIFITSFLILILGIIVFSKNEKQPIVVLSSFNLDIEASYLYPEIAIDEKGKWRVATKEDLWINQKYNIFPYTFHDEENFKEFGNIKGGISSISKHLPAKVQTNKKVFRKILCWGVYSKNRKFTNVGIDKLLLPKATNNDVKKAFENKNKINYFPEYVIKNDWENIKNDFKVKISPNIVDSMVGDLNGDKVNDYVLILGSGNFGNSETEGAALIIYIKDKETLKRIPVDYWEETSDYTGWPKLLFMRDFNNDNAQELFISHSNSDSDSLIVYTWSNNGLIKVFEGKQEIWKGI